MNNYISESKQIDFSFDIKSIDDEGSFSGYASIFDVVDSQKDVIMDGAFNRTLKERGPVNVKLLWQHQMNNPIGYFTSMKEDALGLYVEGKLLMDIQQGKEAYELLKSGSINGLSIGYSVVESYMDFEKGIRYIHDLDLWEVSVVTFPANEHAGVTNVKSNIPKNIREFEHFLRKSGFSRSQSKIIASKGFNFSQDDYSDFSTKEVCLAVDRCLDTLTH